MYLTPLYGNLKEDIAGEKYGLLTDESTDLVVTKFLGVTVRYQSKKTTGPGINFSWNCGIGRWDSTVYCECHKKTLVTNSWNKKPYWYWS